MYSLSSAPTPLPKGTVVLYLDYDGTLHHGEVNWKKNVGAYIDAPARYTLFQHAPLLEKLLEPFPDVKIVLSTSWVVRYGSWKAMRRLPLGLQSRCIGATFSYAIKGNAWHDLPRGEQVSRDAEKRQLTSWFALDDDAADWPSATRSNLIQTSYQEGISPPAVRYAISERLASLSGCGYPDEF
jgi:hypothetical protein